MNLQLQTRNAELSDLIGLLKAQHDVKYDVVVPSTHLYYDAGRLVVVDGALKWGRNGETALRTDAVLNPTSQFEEGISAKLEIPRQYMQRMRSEGALSLLDENVNHWLNRSERNWFVRGFWTDDPEDPGLARAFLSDNYSVIDHLDALFAVLDGVKAGGVPVQVTGGDLSEKKVWVKLDAPDVLAAAPEFMARYRSPHTGESGSSNPLISAGLVVSNSETGAGAFQIVPRITVLVCKNGMTRNIDALRKVHLGSKMEQGPVKWSEETKRANIELIKSQAKDAVQSFLSRGYIEAVANELEGVGGKLLDHPIEAVEQISKEMRYSEAEKQSILEYFVRSGDTTAGGVMQAVTAYAQTLDSPDRAAELEEDAFTVLAKAAAL